MAHRTLIRTEAYHKWQFNRHRKVVKSNGFQWAGARAHALTTPPSMRQIFAWNTHRMGRIDAPHNTSGCNSETVNWYRLRCGPVFGPLRGYRWCLVWSRHNNLDPHYSGLVSARPPRHEHGQRKVINMELVMGLTRWRPFFTGPPHVNDQIKAESMVQHTRSENVSIKLMSTVSFKPTGMNGIITSWLSFW